MRCIILILIAFALCPNNLSAQDINFDPDKEKDIILLQRNRFSGGNNTLPVAFIQENGNLTLYAHVNTSKSTEEIRNMYGIELLALSTIKIYNANNKIIFTTPRYIRTSIKLDNLHIFCNECESRPTYYNAFLEIKYDLSSYYPFNIMSCDEYNDLSLDIKTTLGYNSIYDPNLWAPLNWTNYISCNAQGIWSEECYDNLNGNDSQTYSIECISNENSPYQYSTNKSNTNRLNFSIPKSSDYNDAGTQRIYDIRGRLIKKTTHYNPKDQINLLKPGIYIIMNKNSARMIYLP